MLVQRRDEVLARTDPFDLAQAVDRYVHTLSAERIRALLQDASERLGSYYRGEFLRSLSGQPSSGSPEEFAEVLHGGASEPELQDALAVLLRGNLRAISLFGPSFCDGVLEYVPTDRAVGIGEEHRPGVPRAAVLIAIAVFLLLLGAVGEHIAANARAQSSLPTLAQVPAPTPMPIPTKTLPPTPAPKARRTAAPTAPPSPVASASAAPGTASPATPVPYTPVPSAPPRPARHAATPPPARGVAVVAIPAATPSPQPSALDVTDMPNSYDNATPMPQVTAPPPQAPARVTVAAPTPKPHQSWLHRTLMHLDPFKPNPRATP